MGKEKENSQVLINWDLKQDKFGHTKALIPAHAMTDEITKAY